MYMKEQRNISMGWMQFGSQTAMPIFKEVKGKEWLYFGTDNKFPEQTLRIFRDSSDHRAIVKGKVRFICGSGLLVAPDANGNPGPSHYILNQANQSETFEDVFAKVALDWELHRGYALRIRWNRSGEISRITHVPFQYVRANTEGTMFFICKKWGDIAAEKKKETLDALSETDFVKDCIYYYANYDPASEIYPVPDYVAAMPYMSIDTEIANFHDNNVSSGFTAGTMITLFRGEPENDEKKELSNRLKGKSTGSDNGGTTLLYFADENETAPKVEQLRSNELDKQYLQLAETVQQKIFTAHNVTNPMIFGIKTAGQLGGRNELLDAWELMDASYIKVQQEVLIKSLRIMLEMAKVKVDFNIIRVQPISQDLLTLFDKGIVKKEYVQEMWSLPIDELIIKESANTLSDAINGLSPLVANKVLESLTLDEIRAMVGQGPTDPNLIPKPTQQFSADLWNDESDLKAFEEVGSLESEFEILDDNFKFKNDLSTKEGKALVIVSNEPKTSIADLANALKIDTIEAADILKKLVESKYLKTSSGGGMSITPTGQLIIDELGPETVLITTKWKYDGPKDSKNRPFCKKLMDLKRVYDREEIDALSVRLGYDVWKRRGGWYTVPNTDGELHIPHCRHEWKQVIVRRRTS